MKDNELEGLSLLKSLVYELTYKDDFNAKDLFYYERSPLEEKITPTESYERFIWRVKIRDGLDIYLLELDHENEIEIDQSIFPYPFCFHFNLFGSSLKGKSKQDKFSLTKENARFSDYPVKIHFQPKGRNPASSIFINVNSNYLMEYLDENIFNPEEFKIFSNFYPKKISGFIHSNNSLKDYLWEILNQLNALPFTKKFRRVYIELKIAELVWKTLQEAYKISDTKYYKLAFDKRDLLKIQKSKDILLEDIASPPTLTELAKIVRINEFKLKVGFKKLFGMPPYTYLHEYKMEMARRLLEDRTKSVTEVASEVGYKNFSKFSVAFRKKFGKNPSKMYD